MVVKLVPVCIVFMEADLKKDNTGSCLIKSDYYCLIMDVKKGWAS